MSSELEKGLYTKLVAASTTASSRIYPDLPQGVTFPAIRYSRITTERRLSLNSTVGVTSATIQVDSFATSYSAAKTLADEVRTALHGFSGTLGTLTARLIKLETENDLTERDGDRVTHMVAQRYALYTDMD